MINMEDTVRFTYASWTSNAGMKTPWRRQVGLIFSQTKPWDLDTLVYVVNNQEDIKDFLRFPRHPFFVIHAPPWNDGEEEDLTESEIEEVKRDHPLIRKPARSITKKALRDRERNAWTGDEMFSGGQRREYRYIVTPTVTTVLNRELHPSTLSYQFTLVWKGGKQTFTYREMWELCPIVQSMFHGYHGCPNCDIRGTDCLVKWFKALLDRKGVPVKYDHLQVSSLSSHYSGDRSPNEFIIPRTWNKCYKDKFSGIDEKINTGKPIDQKNLPGIPRSKTIHLKFIPRSKCKKVEASTFLSPYAYTPSETTLNPVNIEENTLQYKRIARKSAETRKHHNSVCGTGDEACMLREEGCDRWKKGYSKNRWPCNRRWTKPERMLTAGRRPFMKGVEHTEEDFLRAFHLGNSTFWCVNPNTGRLCGARYGGLRFADGTTQHVIVRKTGESDDWFVGSWEELLKFVRRWAPWAQQRFHKENEPEGSVSPEARVFYAECAAVRWFETRTLFGYHSSRNVSVGVSTDRKDYTAENTRVTVILESGSTRYFRTPAKLVKLRDWRWFKWIPA